MKKLIALLLALAMVLGMVACTGNTQPDSTTGSTGSQETTGPNVPEDEYTLPKEEGCNQITFYWDYKGDSSKASFWIWPEGGDGRGYLVYECSYGVKCVVNVPQDVTKIGFIACYGCDNPGGTSWIGGTKDYDGDRFVDITGDDMAVYLKSGDPLIYFSSDGGATLDSTKEISFAGMTSFTTIKYNLAPKVRITSLDQVKVYDGDREVEVTGLSSLNNEVVGGTITVGETLDLTKTYTIKIDGYGEKAVLPTTVFDSEEFINNYTYDGDDLGAVISGSATTFKVWAPTASKVVLNLFTAGNGGEAYASLEMNKADRGVWELTVDDCGHGTYYTYSVTTAAGTQEAVDPYAKAAGLNGDRGMVVDLDLTDPEGWENDQVVTLEKYTDAIIWEVHVRDFSNNIASSAYQGKYLAFTEHGLTNSSGVSVGVDYLLNLGVTHIHLLPVYDYASVDESSNTSFNWGYDPKNYNVPEGSYSTDPTRGEVRITEFKQMVQSLHNDGLGVVMDVVYNHTYSANSNLNKIVPYYYYRYTTSGDNSNGSGCGNDTASERYMFRKYMVDSVSYWAEEYDLDGFRFDLMGLHDVETMQAIEQAVHAINPDAIIYGEAWTLSTNAYNNATLATQSNLGKVTATEGAAGAVAAFNDAIRDGLKGSVFESTGQGYINGAYAANATKVQFGIMGGITNNGVGWSIPGAAVINYMSAHDNNTLWDKLHLSNPDNTEEELQAMNRLGAAIVIISKGTPFWQAGEEMLRTKVNADGSFNENSYNASDAVNNIDWEALTATSDEYAMMCYYKGLIEMRQAYSIFRSNGDDVTITFGTLPGGGMTVTYDDGNGSQALVLINPTGTADSYTLSGEWDLVATGTQAGSAVISTESGAVTVDARSVMVFVK